jgi:hypothetical protein
MSLPHRCGEQFFRGRFVAIEFTADAAFMQYDDSIAHSDQFRQLARNEENCFARIG